jgi:hypothetical protein
MAVMPLLESAGIPHFFIFLKPSTDGHFSSMWKTVPKNIWQRSTTAYLCSPI